MGSQRIAGAAFSGVSRVKDFLIINCYHVPEILPVSELPLMLVLATIQLSLYAAVSHSHSLRYSR